MRVVEPGTDDEVTPGDIGELIVASSQNVVEGWLRTGDLVRIDGDGYLYPHGRLSDTINRGGEKFGPVEVEAAIRSHPAVTDCAVAGVPDPEMNERVGAIVVTTEPLDAAVLQQWCAERIAKYKTPELVVFADEVPLTDMGKVDRKAVVRIVTGSECPTSIRATGQRLVGRLMLFVHEVHEVRGRAEDDFEAAIRDEWMPMLGKEDDARLLWFLHWVHGTGPAYNVVTVTAVRDGAAWQRLAERLQKGDLRDWQTQLDAMRHTRDVEHHAAGAVVAPAGRRLRDGADDAAGPRAGDLHGGHRLAARVADRLHDVLGDRLLHADGGAAEGLRLLDIELCFQPAYGAGRRKEAVLWQKVLDNNLLMTADHQDTPAELKQPGMFMHEALSYRDTWRSRLLRTTHWSPL